MITLIGIVAGDILNLLEEKKEALSLADIKSKLNCSEDVIYMAVGSLVRDGYVLMTVKNGEQYLSAMFEPALFSGTFGDVAYAL